MIYKKYKDYIIFFIFFIICSLKGVDNLRIAIIPEGKENMVTMLITGTGYETSSDFFSFSLPEGADSAFIIKTNQSETIEFFPEKIHNQNNGSWIKFKKEKASFAFMINVKPEEKENIFQTRYNMKFSDPIKRLEFEIQKSESALKLEVFGLDNTINNNTDDSKIHFSILQNITEFDSNQIIINYIKKGKNKVDQLLIEENRDNRTNNNRLNNVQERKTIKRYKLYSLESLISVLIIFLFSAVIINYKNLE